MNNSSRISNDVGISSDVTDKVVVQYCAHKIVEIQRLSTLTACKLALLTSSQYASVRSSVRSPCSEQQRLKLMVPIMV